MIYKVSIYVYGECPHFCGLSPQNHGQGFRLKVVSAWCCFMPWFMLKRKFSDSAPLLVPYVYVNWAFQAVFCVCILHLQIWMTALQRARLFDACTSRRTVFQCSFVLYAPTKMCKWKLTTRPFFCTFFHINRMPGPKVMMFWMRHLASNDFVLKRGFQNAHWSL